MLLCWQPLVRTVSVPYKPGSGPRVCHPALPGAARFYGNGASLKAELRCRKWRALRRRMNNHRSQGGKADSAKLCRISFALFHRLKYSLSDDPPRTVRTPSSAEPSTCHVERLKHYSGVAAVRGAFKLMYRSHRRSLNHVRRTGISKELPRGVTNAANFTDFAGTVRPRPS